MPIMGVQNNRFIMRILASLVQKTEVPIIDARDDGKVSKPSAELVFILISLVTF